VQAAMDPFENQERIHQSDADVQCNQPVDEVCQDAFVCFPFRFISIICHLCILSSCFDPFATFVS
jgi:hypothetical protein